MKPFFEEFCDKVITLDKSIRFAGIADGDGHLVAVSERKGLKPLLTPEERAQYARPVPDARLESALLHSGWPVPPAALRHAVRRKRVDRHS